MDPAASPTEQPARPRSGTTQREGMVVYSVQASDTLAGIALVHNMSIEQLKKANKLYSDTVYSGQQLQVLPQKQTAPSTSPTNDNTVPLGSSKNNDPATGKPKAVSYSEKVKIMSYADQSGDRASDEVYKLFASYNVDTKEVGGALSVTSQYVVFEPNLNDPHVLMNGLLPYQLYLSSSLIIDCNVDRKETRPLPSLFLYLLNENKTVQTYHFSLSESDVQVAFKSIMHSSGRGNTTSFYVFKKDAGGVAPAALLKDATKSQDDSSLEDKPTTTPILSKSDRSVSLPEQTTPNDSPSNLTRLEGPTLTEIEESAKSSQNTPQQDVVLPKIEPKEPPRMPELNGRSQILTTEDVQQLCYILPNRVQNKDWILLYSTQVHGIDINTFYYRVKDYSSSILIVEDSQCKVFGAFVSTHWRVEPRFYGSGETFLFTLTPDVRFYPWTGKNDHFMISNKEFIALGGGGHYGLWLDSDFRLGCSKPSDTFGNETISSSPDFICTIMEVWGFE